MGGTRRSGFWFLVFRYSKGFMEISRDLVSGFCSESEVGDAPRCHALLWLTGSARLPRSRAETPLQPTWLPRASDADRRGRCLSCPSPERLSCERRALCECFKYLSSINSVFGSTLLATEISSSQRRRSGQCARRSCMRAPPGAGKASSHATTRADPCRDLPAPGVDNLSLTLITSRDQSEQKPYTRTPNACRFFAVPT